VQRISLNVNASNKAKQEKENGVLNELYSSDKKVAAGRV
jgi:hypothetical protein